MEVFFEGEKVSNSAVAELFARFHTFYFLKMELKTEWQANNS